MRNSIVRVLLALVLLGGFCYAAYSIQLAVVTKRWQARTSPLPHASMTALCSRLSLQSNDALCNGSRPVYAPDFTNALERRFPLPNVMEVPKADAHITYDEVDSVLRAYKVTCQDVETTREYSYFRCLYDLRGDRYWINAFYFYYPERTLFSIRSGSRDDN